MKGTNRKRTGPSAADLAAAAQAVLDAQAALKTAQRNLRYATSPDVSYYEDQLAEAQRAYDSAAAAKASKS